MRYDRGTSRGRLAALFALLAAPLTAAAEETPPTTVAQAQAQPGPPPASANPPKTEAATPPVEVKPPKWYDEIAVNAFVSTGYVFNFNEPANHLNQLRVFDPVHNTFSLTDAQLTVQRPVANAGDVGFRADFDLGGLIPPNTAIANDVGVGQFNVRQAFVSAVAPVGSGLRLDVGKFVTHLGYEVIEGWDNYDDNISRSILFGFAIPFTHLGARVSYTVSPVVSAMLMVANGWDADVARTRGKTIGAQVTLTPAEPVSVILNYVGGYEPATGVGGAGVPGQQFRQVFDAVATVKLASFLTVGGNFDYGWQDSASTVTSGDNATWWGGAGYLRVESPGGFGVAFRGEYFKDDGGTRLGAPHTVYEGTVTPYVKVGTHWMLRAEGRVDASPDDVFVKSDGSLGSNQPTVAVNALFAY